MSLKINLSEMKKILKLFYSLSSIRVVIFDETGKEVLAYPETLCSFCSEVRKKSFLAEKCAKSDQKAFFDSAKNGGCCVYKCHAGLTEATAPLKSGGKIIGYMMFGQITDIKNKDELSALAESMNERWGIAASANGIKYKSRKQIDAAAELLRICTEYIILKDMAVHEGEKKIEPAKKYIDEHMAEELKINDIAAAVGLSRTKLYEVFNAETGMGIAAYIREKRLLRARHLLKETGCSVTQAAQQTGFSDYNYFSRIYKKRFGLSPLHEIKK